MIQGTYDPFQPGDIFSGRMLLIATQAGIYKLAGINIISTQAGSLIIVMLSCYLTLFKLLAVKDGAGTLLAAALFYFNPVITYLTVGITGDAYVMLAGIIICMLLKRWIVHEKSVQTSLLTGTAIAFIIALSLLYKETILVFLPFTCLIACWYNMRKAHQLILSLIIVFSFLMFLYGCLYDYHTGDVFFKISQIKNSSYLHHCSYDVLPFKYLLIRLTYGVWQQFIIEGFYPVIFGAFFSAAVIYRRKNSLGMHDIYPVFFICLLAICLYFPFSLKGYQPLCADARQYMLLLPAGVAVSTSFINNVFLLKNNKNFFVITSVSIAVLCCISTGNKWQWMIYAFTGMYAVLIPSLQGLHPFLKYILLCGILWLSILEHLFFKNSNWFNDMILLNKKIASKYYYFPDHDNMMHWQLLHRFDDRTFAYYNLEKHPFKIFKLYYQQVDAVSFHPGWLIVNKSYTVRSPQFLHSIDSLQKVPNVTQMTEGDISALLIDSPEKLSYITTLILNDGK